MYQMVEQGAEAGASDFMFPGRNETANEFPVRSSDWICNRSVVGKPADWISKPGKGERQRERGYRVEKQVSATATGSNSVPNDDTV